MQAWQDGLKDASSAKDFATDNVRVNFWDTLYWEALTRQMIGQTKATKWLSPTQTMSILICLMKLTQVKVVTTGQHARVMNKSLCFCSE